MKIADLHQIRPRFLRSAHLERDFQDPAAMTGYVITPQIGANLHRVSSGLEKTSGQRAWRITGDYGSGKSSFALLLAHVLAGREAQLPSAIRKVIDIDAPKADRQYIPVLVTGAREPMANAVLRALGKAVTATGDRRNRFTSLDRIEAALSSPTGVVEETEAVRIIVDANSELIAKGKGGGLLVILDELGKFLEFAALHPERQDVYFLQQLAEAATRSGDDPLFIVGLLHQGFNAYSDQLSQSSQKEWEKVAGRYEEIIFDQPLDQVSHLIGAAFSLNRDRLPWGLVKRAETAMRQTLDLSWYGSSAPVTSLTQTAPSLYPLHPTVVPVLVRTFSRFGQNERSLFSFLLSNEPFGLQTFSSKEANVNTFYRLHDLYDYAASSFGNRLGLQSYRNHWNHIDSLVRSFPAKGEMDSAVLKTIGILNLINSPELVPTEEAIVLAVDEADKSEAVRESIRRLHKNTGILHLRGRAGGYSLWSHTSINLEAAYEEASRAVGHIRKVTSRIKDYLDARPLVARRHYIQTGNLRFFEVVYCETRDLGDALKAPMDRADGRICIPLCETAQEVAIVEQWAMGFTEGTEFIIGLTEPLNHLEKLMLEVERWEWVQKNTLELKDDRYAAEEVSRQLAAARETLEKRMQHYVGLNQAGADSASSLRWFNGGKMVQKGSGKDFLALLSKLCDDLYPDAPYIHNELVNRHSISSAAASARMRLIERMLTSSDQPFLGMDQSKKPPEMSIYLSLLQQGRLHVENNGRWMLQEPPAGKRSDPCRFAPTMRRILSILEGNPDGRFNVAEIFAELKKPPFGVRDGVLPLLLTVVLQLHQQEIALYENGTFLSRVDAEELQRLCRVPQNFELQYCKIQGVRLSLFEQLLDVLNFQKDQASYAQILGVVRPLCVFVSELPPYTQRTRKLTPQTLAVRDCILNAREPGSLLFRELPIALSHQPFASERSGELETTETHNYVTDLKASLDELRMAFPLLKDRMRKRFLHVFEGTHRPEDFHQFRREIGDRAEALIVSVTEPDLKAFCFRLMDSGLPESDWIESVGSFLANTPPTRWKDENEAGFEDRLEELTAKFGRVESTNFEGIGEPHGVSLRVALTQRDGTERDRVVRLTEVEDREAQEIKDAVLHLLPVNQRVSMVALSRIIWNFMEKETTSNE